MIPPVKMMERKVLSLGMKLGLSYVNYKDKLLGEQVAYVIDDMLNAVEQGKNTIESNYSFIQSKRSWTKFWKRKRSNNGCKGRWKLRGNVRENSESKSLKNRRNKAQRKKKKN